MSLETAMAAIDRLFETPSLALTVEFQGGEPLLAFSTIQAITEEIVRRNQSEKRSITFTMTTTLQHATNEILQFLKDYQFQVSTSIDGPAWLHNTNRPNPTKDAHERTIEALSKARAVLGIENISALTTLTKASLTCPEEIIDTYINLGFQSIFLRPLSPYGFAVRSEKKIGYEPKEFIHFYERALSYVLEKNRQGIPLEEAYTSILLTHILTPFPSNYVDLRSPTGSGLGVLVYNYDGAVYASDESRMLAEMGNEAFRLGSIHDSYHTLMTSEPMQLLLATGISESLPGCSDCAFLPYCGADPVFSLAKSNDPVGHRAFSQHCTRHMAQFQILFRYLAEADPDIMRIFTAWVTRKHPDALIHTVEAR
jgi:His-Xaa-Ser system radical SAM maturase HxsB